MPFDTAPSPVAPPAASRLWTAVGSFGVPVVVLLALAAARPDMAVWLVGAAALVTLAAWAAHRRRSGEDARVAVPTPAATAGAADRHLLEDAFEALVDPVLVVAGGEADDLAGRRVVLANAAARELLRIPREGALLVPALREPAVLEAVDEALYGGVERTTDFTTPGARPRHWRVMTRPLPGGDGAGPLALVVLRDETDVRRMELMRVDFLANASHELKTPLASLAGFIETLKGHARDDARARDKFLDIMAVQAERMSRLVADLLSLSRIELNEHIPPAGRVDLVPAARDVVDAVGLLAGERGVTLKLESRSGRAPIAGDRDEVVQVIQNLVDNAIKYSGAGQTVEIMVKADVPLQEAAAAWSGGAREGGVTRLPLLTPDREPGQRYAAVMVRDHGPGLAREALPRLTERFYRVEGQKSGERPGTGLGLAIVKHIVNRHRGGLTVESAPGQGATFTAYFPVAAARVPRDAATTDRPLP
ncbi:sensor histidine kinase [Brevundimonas sp.]|uniref:sensor histidine kinase n=1 Tax=Brevundimonas sp. TaxID=1871086 RepID=UPI0035ADCCFC